MFSVLSVFASVSYAPVHGAFGAPLFRPDNKRVKQIPGVAVPSLSDSPFFPTTRFQKCAWSLCKPLVGSSVLCGPSHTRQPFRVKMTGRPRRLVFLERPTAGAEADVPRASPTLPKFGAASQAAVFKQLDTQCKATVVLLDSRLMIDGSRTQPVGFLNAL